MTVILDPTRYWVCPEKNCGARHKSTNPALAITPTHPCREHGGLTIPYIEADEYWVPKGPATNVTTLEREDYVGGEVGLQELDGRPVMATKVERADGSNDVVVYPATAQGSALTPRSS
jgi:hypothetical protein